MAKKAYLATLLAGVILLVMGIFKLGTIIKFIPYPIIIGFTSGIAVTIFTTQIADVFGLYLVMIKYLVTLLENG